MAPSLRFLRADAGLAASYAGLVPVDVVLVSGVLGYLHETDVARLVGALPMLCRAGAALVWSRHCVLGRGAERVPALRRLIAQAGFVELAFETTAADGFAIGRARFAGVAAPLDPSRRLFAVADLEGG